LNRDGKKKYNKVYSKHSKNWRVTAVLKEKTCDFWAALTSGILQRKIDDKDSILKNRYATRTCICEKT
jgi:predicted acetyltransferase